MIGRGVIAGIICAGCVLGAAPAFAQCSVYGNCYSPYSRVGAQHSTSSYEAGRGSSWQSAPTGTHRNYTYNRSRAWDYDRNSRSHYNFRPGDRGANGGQW